MRWRLVGGVYLVVAVSNYQNTEIAVSTSKYVVERVDRGLQMYNADTYLEALMQLMSFSIVVGIKDSNRALTRAAPTPPAP